MGVTLHTRVTLGRDISFAELRSRFDAVLLATGLNKGRELNIPGAHLAGVYNGIDFLINANLGYEIELGKRVVVVGGGNVAIDVARAAVRLVQESWDSGAAESGAESLQPALDAARMALRSGAEQVCLVSLESRQQMPAWQSEVHEAEHEGIAVDNGWGPKEIVGADGVVTGLKVRACVSVFDENGRFNPAFSDEEKVIPCDTVVLAIGQQADLSFLGGHEEVQVTPRGILKIDENLMTTAPGVFAGGDVAFGPRVLVEAVANGHRAARSIHVYFNGKSDEDRAEPLSHLQQLGDAARLPGHPAPDHAGAARQPPHRDRRGGTGLRRSAGTRRRTALPEVPGQHDLRRVEVHPVRRMRGRLSGELPSPGGPGAGAGRRAVRRPDSKALRRVRRRTSRGPGGRHHQERREVHSLRALRPAVPHPCHHHGGPGAAGAGGVRVSYGEARRMKRRSFLSWGTAGLVALWSAVGVSLGAVVRFLTPSVFYEPPQTFKIGNPADFSFGPPTFLADEKIFVFRDREKGFAVASAVCTHLGCTVGYFQSDERFHCPCHGSVFAADGSRAARPRAEAARVV